MTKGFRDWGVPYIMEKRPLIFSCIINRVFFPVQGSFVYVEGKTKGPIGVRFWASV